MWEGWRWTSIKASNSWSFLCWRECTFMISLPLGLCSNSPGSQNLWCRQGLGGCPSLKEQRGAAPHPQISCVYPIGALENGEVVRFCLYNGYISAVWLVAFFLVRIKFLSDMRSGVLCTQSFFPTYKMIAFCLFAEIHIYACINFVLLTPAWHPCSTEK